MGDQGAARTVACVIVNDASCLIDLRKGRLLYGLTQARAGIRERDEAIVCEGNLDVVRLHACGFGNAVGHPTDR